MSAAWPAPSAARAGCGRGLVSATSRHRQDQGVLWRGQIGGHLRRGPWSRTAGRSRASHVSTMCGLRAERSQDPRDSRLRHLRRFSHRRRRPLRFTHRRRLAEHLGDQHLDLLVRSPSRRPRTGRSARPSSQSAANRDRRLRTVSLDTSKSSATRAFDRPSAHSSTTLDRSTSA